MTVTIECIESRLTGSTRRPRLVLPEGRAREGRALGREGQDRVRPLGPVRRLRVL